MILFVIVGTYWWIDLIQLQGFNWQNLVKVVRGGVAACKLENFLRFFLCLFWKPLIGKIWTESVCLSKKRRVAKRRRG